VVSVLAPPRKTPGATSGPGATGFDAVAETAGQSERTKIGVAPSTASRLAQAGMAVHRSRPAQTPGHASGSA
jgi:hypothetical protein